MPNVSPSGKLRRRHKKTSMWNTQRQNVPPPAGRGAAAFYSQLAPFSSSPFVAFPSNSVPIPQLPRQQEETHQSFSEFHTGDIEYFKSLRQEMLRYGGQKGAVDGDHSLGEWDYDPVVYEELARE